MTVLPPTSLRLTIRFRQIEPGRLRTEFVESTHIHIRTWMKLSEGFVWGTNKQVSSLFWKFWRCHQSEWTRGKVIPFGTSGIANTNFIVGHCDGPFLCHSCCYREQSQVAGAKQVVYKHRSPQFQLPFGDWNPATREYTNTQWVQLDVSYRLGEPDKDNGAIDVWINRAKQAPFEAIVPAYGAVAPITGTGLVVNPRSHDGRAPGFNEFSFLDNYANLTIDWTRQHYMYVDSIHIYDGIPNDLPRG